MELVALVSSDGGTACLSNKLGALKEDFPESAWKKKSGSFCERWGKIQLLKILATAVTGCDLHHKTTVSLNQSILG